MEIYSPLKYYYLIICAKNLLGYCAEQFLAPIYQNAPILTHCPFSRLTTYIFSDSLYHNNINAFGILLNNKNEVLTFPIREHQDYIILLIFEV